MLDSYEYRLICWKRLVRAISNVWWRRRSGNPSRRIIRRRRRRSCRPIRWRGPTLLGVVAESANELP